MKITRRAAAENKTARRRRSGAILAVSLALASARGSSCSGNAAMSFAASPNTPTERAMFFTICSPRSVKVNASLSRICSFTVRETHNPPGSHKVSSRAATFTPSPKMSFPSIMISPRLMPMRSTMRLSSASSALRLNMPRWTATAQATASTTLGELDEQTVAGGLDDAPAMAGDGRIEQIATMGFQLSLRVPTSSTPIRRL